MPIVKIARRENPYVMIDKTALEDPALSWEAKGLLCYLLSKPPDWEVRIADLKRHNNGGETHARSALNELRTKGYATMERIRGKDGKIADVIWTVYEVPQEEQPRMEKPRLENPHVANVDITNNDKELSNKLTKNERGRARKELSPAVACFFELTGTRANRVQARLIDAAGLDIVKWRETLQQWMARGWSPRNVPAMLERYNMGFANGGRKLPTHVPDKVVDFDELKRAVMASGGAV